VPDVSEAFRKNVNQKSTDEFVGVKSHHLGFVVRSIVFPVKTDLAILAGEKTIVGDGDATGIATQIVQNLVRSSEGAFGVHSPIHIGDRFKIAGKHCRFGETRKMAEEAELAGLERGLKAFEEPPAI
jgi:hypothetical protein